MNRKKIRRILLASGGTGGHLIPALILSDYFLERNIKIRWITTEGKMEKRLLMEKKISFHALKMRGFLGKKKKIISSLYLIKAFFISLVIIVKFKPDIVFCFGSYATLPVSLACKLLIKKLAIHEQNAQIGVTNLFLSYLATYRMSGMNLTIGKNRFTYTGNPIKREILDLKHPKIRYENRNGDLKILILGGSLGSNILNSVVPKTLFYLKKDKNQHFTIHHQSGTSNYLKTYELYKSYKLQAKISAFIHDIAEAYGEADLVISRSGALTVSEIAACGVAAIFVPYAGAVYNHQVTNANFLVEKEAGLLIKEADFNYRNLADILLGMKRQELANIAQKAFSYRKIDATEKIYKILITKKKKIIGEK